MMDDVEQANTASPKADSKSRPDDEAVSIVSDDNAIILKGQLDPVYEEKARVLNRAVSNNPSKSHSEPYRPNKASDPEDWHGMVSMAALRCRRLRLGV
jgi:hypothetical protein